MIQDVFVENDWEEGSHALSARDQRVAQLQAAGYRCRCITLYRITDGSRVFLVEAEATDPPGGPTAAQSRKGTRSKAKAQTRSAIDYR